LTGESSAAPADHSGSKREDNLPNGIHNADHQAKELRQQSN